MRSIESEVFRFGVIRPPRREFTLDSLEAAPLPHEKEIVGAIIDAKSEAHRIASLKKLKPSARLDRLDLVGIARTAGADKAPLTWAQVAKALEAKKGKDKD